MKNFPESVSLEEIIQDATILEMALSSHRADNETDNEDGLYSALERAALHLKLKLQDLKDQQAAAPGKGGES